MKTRGLLLPLIGVLFMVMASATTFAQLTNSAPPSWIDDANSRRHFTLPSLVEVFDDPWGTGFTATLTTAPMENNTEILETYLYVNNAPDPNKIKLVWLQYSWHDTGETGMIVDPSEPNQNLVRGSTGVFSTPEWFIEDLGGGNWRKTITWTITPQPKYEWFKWWTFGGKSLTDIKVATICVPEPSSMIAMLGGLTGLIGLSRRKS
jgi:hypothetical protein